ncbi:MAG: ExbD/TolR family protein [Planctomycetota bacterium]|jgi:biopolymer transport protein ExbD
MRIRELQVEEDTPVTIMPLIDMVFLLLIFFLVATTFVKAERDTTVQIPGTASEPLSAPPKKHLIINIARNGAVNVGGEHYTLDRLEKMLTYVAEKQPTREVLIRADERGRFKHFAKVVDRCRMAGISELRIGYLAQPTKDKQAD